MSRFPFPAAWVLVAAALLVPAGSAQAQAQAAGSAYPITQAELRAARIAGYAIVVVPGNTDAATRRRIRKAWAAQGVPPERVYFEARSPV